MKDIMEFMKQKNVPGIAVFLDFEKAFDSVKWDFQEVCLQSLNFSPQLRRWINTFLKERKGKNKEVKLSQYADDTTAFLANAQSVRVSRKLRPTTIILQQQVRKMDQTSRQKEYVTLLTFVFVYMDSRQGSIKEKPVVDFQQEVTPDFQLFPKNK